MTTITMSSGARVWRKRAASGYITHAQAVQFCHAIYSLAQGDRQRGKRLDITEAEAEQIADEMLTTMPIVDEAAAQRGRLWLHRYAADFGLPRLDYLAIVQFRFVDVNETPGRYESYYSPIYEATWADGSTLRYAPTPWQASASIGDRKGSLWFNYKEAA